jgi:hypothetical protein
MIVQIPQVSLCSSSCMSLESNNADGWAWEGAAKMSPRLSLEPDRRLRQ